MNNVLTNPQYNLIPRVMLPASPVIKVPDIQSITPPDLTIPEATPKQWSNSGKLLLVAITLVAGYIIYKSVIEPRLNPDRKNLN